MKKTIIAFAIMLFTQFTFAQSFNGVPISGDMATAVTRFKAKGFTVTDNLKNMTVMKGTIQGIPTEVFIKVTPISKQVYAFSMYFTNHISWFGIKGEYDKFKDILTEKYGQPDNEYDFFSTPYYLGDGYELQALRLEKCTYATYWFGKENMNIALEMSKYEQVNITYENQKLIEVRSREVEQLNKTIF